MQAATLDRRRRKATLPTRLGDPSTPFSKSSAGIKTKTEDQNNKKRHRTTQTETELPIRKRSRPLDTPLFYVPNPVTDAVVGSVARRLMEIDSLVCVCVSVCVWLCGREDAIGLRRQRRSVDARRRAYRTVWATCWFDPFTWWYDRWVRSDAMAVAFSPVRVDLPPACAGKRARDRARRSVHHLGFFVCNWLQRVGRSRRVAWSELNRKCRFILMKLATCLRPWCDRHSHPNTHTHTHIHTHTHTQAFCSPILVFSSFLPSFLVISSFLSIYLSAFLPFFRSFVRFFRCSSYQIWAENPRACKFVSVWRGQRDKENKKKRIE